MTDKKQVLADADAEIAAFEAWFRGQGAEPLARFEAAILKTFLVAKATKKFRAPSPPGDPRTSTETAENYNHYQIP
jgi:hypothetical protein